MFPCVRRNPNHDPATCKACIRRSVRATEPKADRAASARVSLPCLHLGERVRIAGSERDWRFCAAGVDHGQGPGVVCGCLGCGPRCPRYSPGEVE